MARQRFIWPDLWTDPGFGTLEPLAQLLYIGMFSTADDEGRLLADPVILKSTILPYSRVSIIRIGAARRLLEKTMPKLMLYEVAGVEYLWFTNWTDWQKPKYAKSSRFPAPPNAVLEEAFQEDQRNDSGNGSGNGSSVGRVGLDRDGLDRDGGPPDPDDLGAPCELLVNELAVEDAPVEESADLLPAVPTANTLVGEFIDSARAGQIEVPRKIVGHLARSIKELLDEGQSVEAVRAGLARMVERRIIQPGLLANFVMEAALPANRKQTPVMGYGLTTQEMLDIADRLEKEGK